VSILFVYCFGTFVTVTRTGLRMKPRSLLKFMGSVGQSWYLVMNTLKEYRNTNSEVGPILITRLVPETSSLANWHGWEDFINVNRRKSFRLHTDISVKCYIHNATKHATQNVTTYEYFLSWRGQLVYSLAQEFEPYIKTLSIIKNFLHWRHFNFHSQTQTARTHITSHALLR
jgi:hypothetical protein